MATTCFIPPVWQRWGLREQGNNTSMRFHASLGVKLAAVASASALCVVQASWIEGT